MTRRSRWILALLCLLAPLDAVAARFAPITQAERALTEVPAHPEAAAVVLFREGDFQMRNPARGEQFSTLTVRARIKVLTEDGRDLAQFRIFHGRSQRLGKIRARTVLPDGTEVPVDEDSTFETALSSSNRWLETTIAFPQVEVGAILDYWYELRWDSWWYLDPWLFQESIPTLRSEIVYHLPEYLGFQGWQRDPTRVGIEREIVKTGRGRDVKVWVENAGPVLDEPYSFPDIDLTARFILVPTAYAGDPLLHSWRFTCDFVQDQIYNDALRGDGAVRRKAKELTRELPDAVAKANEVYRFVRDEIETLHWPGVLLGPDRNTGVVLEEGRGDYAEKALVLRSMLQALKIRTELVWVADRAEGIIDTELPTFTWFDSMMLRVELPSETVYLDPSSRNLPFGHIDPGYEGTQALLFDPKKPEVVTLPVSAANDNERSAQIDLQVDAEGRLHGSGNLVLTGHRALWSSRRREAGEALDEDWLDWLEDKYPGFEISDVTAEESISDGEARITWSMAQREEEVLGDEASLTLARPFGPATQPFGLPAARRRTPVRFAAARRDHSEVTISWPEGWELDVTPGQIRFDDAVGALEILVEVDEEQRQLTYRRAFEVRGNQFFERHEYTALRTLYGEAAKHDAQSLVLARP